MKIREGDIIVCAPGFSNGGLPDGGSGYQEGLMVKARENGSASVSIHWGFLDGNGVFNKALRLATDLEIKAFNSGITNIKDIQEKTFRISYVSNTGENKATSVEAINKQDAIEKIKDLKTINYVMTY